MDLDLYSNDDDYYGNNTNVQQLYKPPKQFKYDLPPNSKIITDVPVNLYTYNFYLNFFYLFLK